MANIVVEFNNKKYNAIYNKNTDEYEVELTAPETGGIYNTEITCTEDSKTESTNIDVRILKRKPLI